MKQINSHNIKRLKALIINHINISFFIIVFLFTIVLYNVYTQPGSHRFLADNSVTLLTYLVGLTALIAFTVTFFNSFISTNMKAIYLRRNRNLFRLSKVFGYSSISSKIFRGSLLFLYFIPISLALANPILSKVQNIINSANINSININSLLLSSWYATYLSCLFSLILTAYDCLSLLWARSDMLQSERDKTDDMIDEYCAEEFNELLIQYFKYGRPKDLTKSLFNSSQGYEALSYLYAVFSPDNSTKIATLIYHTLFMNKKGQKKKIVFHKDKTNAKYSSKVSFHFSFIRHYLEQKWEYLSTLEMEDNLQDLLLDFISYQCKEDTELCLNICASWKEEYTKKVFVHYPEGYYFSKQQVDQLLYKIAQCYIKVYLHNDADPEKIIALHEKLNNAIDIGKNGNIQATQEVKKVLEETQKAIESDYLETVYEFLRTYPWQERGWQVWKVKDYIKSISELDKSKTEDGLLCLINKQNITDSVLLEAILEFLSIEQCIRHLIFTCVASHDKHENNSPIVVSYELYESIIRNKSAKLNELRKYPKLRTTLIESISKDIDKFFSIDHPFYNVPVNEIIDSIFSDRKIDQQLINEMSRSFGIVNYLALRSCLTSEYDVVPKISPDIAESPQKEDLRDSIKSTQKNYPKTIPSVMARLSQILQIK